MISILVESRTCVYARTLVRARVYCYHINPEQHREAAKLKNSYSFCNLNSVPLCILEREPSFRKSNLHRNTLLSFSLSRFMKRLCVGKNDNMYIIIPVIPCLMCALGRHVGFMFVTVMRIRCCRL